MLFFRMFLGAAQPLIPAQHPQFHPNAPNGALPPPPPPPPPLPPQPSPHQGNTAAPAQPTGLPMTLI